MLGCNGCSGLVSRKNTFQHPNSIQINQLTGFLTLLYSSPEILSNFKK